MRAGRQQEGDFAFKKECHSAQCGGHGPPLKEGD